MKYLVCNSLVVVFLALSIGCSAVLEEDQDRFIQEVGRYRYELRSPPQSPHGGKVSPTPALPKREGVRSTPALPEGERDGHLHFVLNIQMADGQAVEDFLQQTYGHTGVKVLNQLRFELQKDFQVEIGGAVLPCVLYHLEASPFKELGLNLNLVFNGSEVERSALLSETIIFRFQDRVLSGQEVLIRVPPNELKATI